MSPSIEVQQDIESSISTLTRYGLIPSQQQEALLRACLLSGEVMQESLREWQSLVNVDDVDYASHRLLPLLHYNLSKQGVNDSNLERYKGTSRKAWYKNQMLMNELNSLTAMLQEKDVRVMILKGAALLLEYYPNYGLRPMGDLDVLVPSRQVEITLAELDKGGWSSIMVEKYLKGESAFFKRKNVDSGFFATRSSCGFRNKREHEFDLHTHIFTHRETEHLETEFWNRSVEIKLTDGLTVEGLSPTDTLLHVLVHGLKGHSNQSIRWIPDAYLIIAQSQIDWRLLLTTANNYNLIAFVKFGLTYMHQRLHVEIPEFILSAEVPEQSLQNFDAENQPKNKVGNLRFFWKVHSKLNEDISVLVRLLRFPKYIQDKYMIRQFWQVPLYLFYKGIRTRS